MGGKTMSDEQKKAMYLHYIETADKLEHRANAVLEILQEVGEINLEKYDIITNIDYDIEDGVLCYRLEDYYDDIEYLEYPLQYLWMNDEDIKKDVIQRRDERLRKAAEEKEKAERLRQEAQEKAERTLYEKLKQKYETEDK